MARKIKMYEFVLRLLASGETPEEAWGEILLNRVYRPVSPDEYYMPTEYKVVDEWEEEE